MPLKHSESVTQKQTQMVIVIHLFEPTSKPSKQMESSIESQCRENSQAVHETSPGRHKLRYMEGYANSESVKQNKGQNTNRQNKSKRARLNL